MYHIYESHQSQMIVHTTSDGNVLWIPCDPANTDYQRYLEWLAAGNVPEPWVG